MVCLGGAGGADSHRSSGLVSYEHHYDVTQVLLDGSGSPNRDAKLGEKAAEMRPFLCSQPLVFLDNSLVGQRIRYQASDRDILRLKLRPSLLVQNVSA